MFSQMGPRSANAYKKIGVETSVSHASAHDLVDMLFDGLLVAVRSAKAMGLRVAGVDMLRSNHGPVVMEVNSSPGLEGIEKATGKNIAGKIFEFVVKDAEARRGQTVQQA